MRGPTGGALPEPPYDGLVHDGGPPYCPKLRSSYEGLVHDGGPPCCPNERSSYEGLVHDGGPPYWATASV